MKFHENKLLTTAAAVALALAVGACSSSSDDDEMAGTPPPVTDGDGDAMNGDGDAMNGDGDGDAKTPAQALAAAQDVYKALTDASTDEDRATAVAALEEALMLAGNEAAYLAYLEKKVLDQAQTVADAAAKAGLADRIAREEKIGVAIDGIVTTVAKPLPGMASGVTEGLVASRSVAGMVTIDVNGADEDDDYAGGATPAGSGDWNSVTMTKTDAEGNTDTVVLYTDIAAPADVLFRMQYVGVTNFLAAADVKKARSDNFPSGATRTIVYGANSDGTDSGNPLLFRGTFDDLPGVFTCDVLSCTLTTNDKGVLNEAAQNWTFTPDAANTATVKVPDAGYAYFGWWLNKPKDNKDPHMVDVFAGGSDDMHAATVTDLIVGTATYAGPAAGKYVTKTFTAGVHSDSGVGHFTAKANLTAKFGDAEGDDVRTIDGSVTNFMLDDTTAASWKVTLEDIILTEDDMNFNGTTEVDFGGGATASDVGAGVWQGRFYGAATDPADAPSTVAGTFDAGTDNASVVGAFGATKQ